MTQYAGFAQVEYDYIRAKIYPGFDWVTFDEPSPRRVLESPLAGTRVALVSTTQRAVLEACLREATRAHPPGAIVDLGFRWKEAD